jgi:hypothetical protein
VEELKALVSLSLFDYNIIYGQIIENIIIYDNNVQVDEAIANNKVRKSLDGIPRRQPQKEYEEVSL